MTESRIQVGASQDYLNTNKITTGAGEVQNEIVEQCRPGERFTTQDEWLKAQEALTKLKAKPKRQQNKVTKKAVAAVMASTDDVTLEAREYLEDYEGALNRLDNLEIVLSAYFMLRLRNRQNDDIAAMLMMGLL
jgi:hypothetical protein